MSDNEWCAKECLIKVHKRYNIDVDQPIPSIKNQPIKPIEAKEDITLPMLIEMRQAVANFIALHSEAYLPIFIRLDEEIEIYKNRERLLKKAYKLFADNSDNCES